MTRRITRKSLGDRSPFRLGLVALACLGVLALVVVLLSRATLGQVTYTAMFTQSADLEPGEDVQVAGVRVGEVRSVALAGNRVAVTFTVDDRIHLGARTSAAIQVATLLGTHLLQVVPHGAGHLPHDTIPVSRTEVPFNLQDVLGKGTDRLAGLDGKELAKMLTAMSDVLARSDGHLSPALHGVIRLSDLLTRHGDQIGRLLSAARRVAGELGDSSTDLVTLMKQTNLVVDEVTSRRQAIHRLLTEATRLSRNVRAVISDTRADTGPALRAVNTALSTLRAQDSTLRHVLDVMAPAVRYVANATGNGPYIDLWNKGNLLPPQDFALCGPAARIPAACR